MSGVRIGIDFDNTIICYDNVFSAAAQQRGLIRDGWVAAKSEIRALQANAAAGLGEETAALQTQQRHRAK